MKISYYRDGENYIAVTKDYPPGFKGVLLIGKGPKPGHGIDAVCETCYELNQLKKLDQVDKDDVPDEWLLALGYDQPKPKPRPIMAIPAVPVVVVEPLPAQNYEVTVDWFPWKAFGKYEGKDLPPDQKRLCNWMELGILSGFVLWLLIK